MKTDMETLKVYARSLRSNQTDAELKLWYYLRKRQRCKIKFRRQVILEPFIVDFLAMSIKLVIELDGGQHQDNVVYDSKRDWILRNRGYTILRFWNNEVLENIDGVVEKIEMEIGKLLKG